MFRLRHFTRAQDEISEKELEGVPGGGYNWLIRDTLVTMTYSTKDLSISDNMIHGHIH